MLILPERGRGRLNMHGALVAVRGAVKLFVVGLLAMIALPRAYAQCGPSVLAHTGGATSALATKANALYVGLPELLEIRDTTNPAAPVLQSTVGLPGVPIHIEVSGSLLYVACGDAGLRVIDITIPAAPAAIMDYAGADTKDVAISGGKVFVAREDEVTILDASGPNLPIVLGHYVPPIYRVLGVESRGDTLFTLELDDVKAIDASNPASPTVVAS